MGELGQHDLKKYIDKYGCKVFVETGTGRGEGLAYAQKSPFELLFSTEIIKELYDKVVQEFNFVYDSRIKIYNATSKDILFNLLPQYTKGLVRDWPILFWLDAHFPGADFQLGKYDDEHPREIKLPLEAELSIIRGHWNSNRHVIIIDDLRMLEDGNYELGNAPNRESYGYKNGIKFIEDMFGESHKITKDLRHQGFLILDPKCCQS